MLSGDFIGALRILNPKLRICSFGDNGKMAGIYYIDAQGNYEDICSIDKNQIPEFPAYDQAGRLVKVGWRRAVFILLQQRFTTTRKVRRLWPGFFMRREPAPTLAKGDPIAGRLQDINHPVLSSDELLSLAADIRKKDTPKVQEERDHDRWFLETWRNNGGNASDRPVY